jgi:hypothetical protein
MAYNFLACDRDQAFLLPPMCANGCQPTIGAGVADEEVRRPAHPSPSAQPRHLTLRSTTTAKAVVDSPHHAGFPPAVGVTNVEQWL